MRNCVTSERRARELARGRTGFRVEQSDPRRERVSCRLSQPATREFAGSHATVLVSVLVAGNLLFVLSDRSLERKK